VLQSPDYKHQRTPNDNIEAMATTAIPDGWDDDFELTVSAADEEPPPTLPSTPTRDKNYYAVLQDMDDEADHESIHGSAGPQGLPKPACLT
jgi:hypothetical protein